MEGDAQVYTFNTTKFRDGEDIYGRPSTGGGFLPGGRNCNHTRSCGPPLFQKKSNPFSDNKWNLGGVFSRGITYPMNGDDDDESISIQHLENYHHPTCKTELAARLLLIFTEIQRRLQA